MKSVFLLHREIKKGLAHELVRCPSFYMHFHSYMELYVIHSGEVETFINDRRQVLRAGDISFACSYDSHAYRTISEDALGEYLSIPRDYCKEILPLLERKQASPFISDSATYETISAAMKRLSDHPNEISTRGLIYIILGAILDHAQASQQEKPSQLASFSPEMLIYISEHFREELTLSMLAKQFGYNPSYLSRSFKENFGISLSKYITMLRLREAILLLKSGEYGVTKCALESGFGSTRSFYRAFHEEFGVTPKEYQSIEDEIFK